MEKSTNFNKAVEDVTEVDTISINNVNPRELFRDPDLDYHTELMRTLLCKSGSSEERRKFKHKMGLLLPKLGDEIARSR